MGSKEEKKIERQEEVLVETALTLKDCGPVCTASEERSSWQVVGERIGEKVR